jgi:hypothetical protein
MVRTGDPRDLSLEPRVRELGHTAAFLAYQVLVMPSPRYRFVVCMVLVEIDLSQQTGTLKVHDRAVHCRPAHALPSPGHTTRQLLDTEVRAMRQGLAEHDLALRREQTAPVTQRVPELLPEWLIEWVAFHGWHRD